ncbi:hypothetical protein ACFL3Z_02125 [Gemmatimonadota bacterium]
MTAKEIADFLRAQVPTFQDIEVLSTGRAFHYTPHADRIEAFGRFLGAPLTVNIDRTQDRPESPQATSDPGVVFAYAALSDAVEEGFNTEIFEISYQSAVRATHSQEAELGAPPTILISSSEISECRRLGRAEELGDQS